MLRIVGGDIEYESRVVARFVDGPLNTWRRRAADVIECAELWTEETQDKAINEALDEQELEHKVALDEQELEHKVALDEQELEHKVALDALEAERDDWQERAERAEKLLDAIDDGMTALEAIAAARVDADFWQKAASDYKAAYEAATAPKPKPSLSSSKGPRRVRKSLP